MKWLACGGAPLNADLAHFFNGFDGITFIQGYGMTETAAPCLVNFQDANEVGSVGRPGCISIRLADDDELMIKGANVFLGYYKQPQRTAEALTSDGWLHTGDLATIDDRGFVFITGRKKDIIITAGGKNISRRRWRMSSTHARSSPMPSSSATDARSSPRSSNSTRR